ncbi:MAG: hypothetical protein GY861_15245 [bacterium]|nr:hypothetical protein [bacterium]
MVDLIKELNKLGDKLKSGKPLQPFEIKEYNLYIAMQTMINLQARTEEQIMEIAKEDMAKTFYMLGKLFFGEEWERIPVGEPVQEEENEELK